MFGFREIREVSSAEVERYVARMTEENPAAESSGMALPTKTEMTQEEWSEMVAGMRANADLYGRRRN